MSTLPHVSGRKVVQALIKIGYERDRQKGSHKQFRHADGRFTTLPFHSNRDISPILLRQISKDIGLTAEEFIRNR